MALMAGKPLFTDDLTTKDYLIVKALRSPHAFAKIVSIDTSKAKLVPGIECVLTHEDVPHIRFTEAGQTYPEASPYDRYILEDMVRYVGDEVALVAGTTEKAVNKALKLIKVEYEILTPVLDFRNAKDHPVLVHPEEDWVSMMPVGADNRRNLCATDGYTDGDVEAVLADCAYVVEGTYHTLANNQAMMEPFVTSTALDAYGRLVVTSATQIPFHVRRIVARALGISKARVRVIKPRIGGGFGAKQTAVSEVYPAIVTWLTGKPCKMIFTRREVMIASTSRHEMEVTVRIGADKNGRLQAIDLYTLSNTGAYGEHGPTTVGLSGHKSISLYGPLKASRFTADVVYTNTMSAGAYRGYGATQGIFALESAMDELAVKMDMDPMKLREINIIPENVPVASYYGETFKSVGLHRCLKKAKEMIGWDEKYPVRDMGNGKVRAVGGALAMQGSGISGVDQAAVEIRLGDEGTYNLLIGATDMGTGCDTILAQMAAECLECDLDKISVHGVDTDVSPYDTGSYASSTTYVTGGAVIKTCETLKKKMTALAAEKMDCPVEHVEFDGTRFYSMEDEKEISLSDLADASHFNRNDVMSASESFTSPVSPPPFMAGIVEIELDKETGQVEIIDYAAAVDCGTPINRNLARVQTEGGIVQGIGMALFENIQYRDDGMMMNNSFMQYKIPTRIDMGKIHVEFESTYEPTGPFGAKSIGEIVINTPSPALANAIYHACGVRLHELPMTAERIKMGMLALEK
ncbi:xanthine dehydrogenase family protein molybdopterin-binding subunit [Frisingicoccus sp.]|uniref:xanthine dehydrogenase family protein molybdopterin-binding subunit n=1 Tax=Frisingicoccus sp. TaxID=1918627 RepID=UPI00399B6FBA